MIKKMILMLLVLVGGVVSANAWNFLKGSFNNWTGSADYCLDKGPVAVYLVASETPYEFKIDGGTWYGANNNADITSTTTITSFSENTENSNFKLTVTTSGYYVFSTNWDNGLSLTVRYPNTMVYFYNALGWTNVYLHDGYWNGENGASNVNALRGVAMTAGDNNIYSAYIPSESFYRVTFTSDKQVNNGSDQHGEGYDNFYSTNVVWNADQFNSNTPLYVPTTNVGGTPNGCSYYYGGSWIAYPTYTRESLNSGNLGTICLPFNATVTGATVYKIVGKTLDGSNNLTGIYAEPVTNLVAGHAYLFKATATSLTATYSGSYTAASEADGMLGNLSSSPVAVPAGNYIIKENKIRKVVGGTITIGQYKAYITLKDIDVITNAPGLTLIDCDDNATGIDGLEIENSQDVIYDMQGRQVKGVKKGLYIINGKKVLVK